MPAARIIDAAIVAVAVTVAGVAVALDDQAGPLEMLFGAVLLAAALQAARLVLTGYWRAARERETARRLAQTPAAQVAADAVVEERVRLAADIEAVVRAAVTRMRALADQALRDWDQDPVPSLHRVQEEGRHATQELRRLLGLLRQANPMPPTEPDPPSRSGARVRPLDVGIAAAVAVFAVAERYLYGESFVPGMSTPVSLLLTAAAAATIVLRRTAPGVGAAACGLIFLGAALVQRPVSGGFWVLATMGGLAWAAAGRRTWSEAAGLAVLLAGVAAGQARGDPDNLSITLLVLVVGAGGGALWAWSDMWRTAAHARAQHRAAELASAADDAVHAERVGMARDLHDVLSHAVGVMVMQAGAAEVLLPPDRHRARAALDVVCRTADETLSELDRLVAVIRDGAIGGPLPAGGVSQHDSVDLRALVQRMRGAGLDVTLTLDRPVAGDLGAAVYRIVQEALTNALRHAPGARVVVTVTAGPSAATVEVVDDGPGAADQVRRGYGLVGIAERVQRLGGQLTTGTGPTGTGFRVHARMPVGVGDPP